MLIVFGCCNSPAYAGSPSACHEVWWHMWPFRRTDIDCEMHLTLLAVSMYLRG